MSERGYVVGKNLILERRNAEGKFDRLPALAAELVRLRMDIICASGPAIQAVRDATGTIPIIMTFGIDPVGEGFVASLARPGGQITGPTILAPELAGKRLELLKQAVPGANRVAVLASSGPGRSPQVEATEAAARSLGVRLQILEVRDPDRYDDAFLAMRRERASALLVLSYATFFTVRCEICPTVQNKPHSPRGESERGGGPPLSEGPAGRAARLRCFSASAGAFPANEAVRGHGNLTSAPLSNERRRIIDLAARQRLPVMAPFREFPEAGGFMAYGASIPDLWGRVPAYVDKILKGAKPGDLPTEQPKRFELVINLKTAKALGLTVPQSVLFRADQVIE